jgi:pyruvate kinase
VKLPGKTISLPVLTDRDLRNIRQAAEYGVTGLLQPFVRSGEDLKELRRLLEENNAGFLQIFAKIESMEGVEHLEEILPYADVIVIARGDLGNDMPLWQLPAVQKQISAACRAAEKPFIVVTQMLASMENAPIPTRAEVSDIFNAVIDGAWGVMLTGETAVGKYPVEAIRYLTKTAESAQVWGCKA